MKMQKSYNDGPAQRSSDQTTSMTGRIDDMREKAEDVKERLADATRRASDRIDAQREPAASTLENAAERLRERGDSGTNVTARAARTTADKLQATAEYIRENDVRAMMDDMQDVVRRHPGPALAAAVVAGFLVGKAFSSN